ncbi:addA [Symbiodinium sp. CCMP2456]|nr:addA [Symbiodinium sp. CCMP2456]
MFEETQQKNVVESLCVLYVALTRAVHGLHMVIKPRPQPKSGGDGPSKSFSGIILNGLTDIPYPLEQQLLYSQGNPAWFESVEKKATEQEGGRLRRVKDLLKEETVSAGMQYGSAMHHWMESVTWQKTFHADRDTMIASARTLYGDFAYGNAFDHFQSVLQSDAAIELLDQQTYLGKPWWDNAQSDDTVSVHCEFPFAITHQGSVLRGSIDRLALVKRDGQVIAADVIDFKTDTFDDAKQLKDKVRHYRPQVDAYRGAVAQIFKLPAAAIRGTLFFVHKPQTICWREEGNE